MRHTQAKGGLSSAMRWTAGIVAAGAATWAVRDYVKWMSLGPGGLPANMRGWLTMTKLRFLAQDGLELSSLKARRGASHDRQFWADIRRRVGKRPTVSPYPVPHRQLDQLPDQGMRTKLARVFDQAVAQHAGEVEYQLSHFEKRHPAVTLKTAQGKVGARSHREIAHIHPSDSSMHMILGPSDAVAAIECGWAELHGLAGIAVGLPVTYLMVYAPRDETDLVVVAELLDTAIKYAMQRDGERSLAR